MTTDEIRTYILTEILGEPDGTLADDEDLLLSETLDSLSVTRLVQHIEERARITVPPEDVTLDNFATLTAIAGYVAVRRAR
ncbi:MAG: acyl carrier protein [Planctomycetota bacterium]